MFTFFPTLHLLFIFILYCHKQCLMCDEMLLFVFFNILILVSFLVGEWSKCSATCGEGIRWVPTGGKSVLPEPPLFWVAPSPAPAPDKKGQFQAAPTPASDTIVCHFEL